MVKLPVAGVLTAMLLASAVASAQAIPQALPAGVRDIAIGDGTNSEVAYHFDVRSGPSGEDPSGSASVSGPFVPPFISTQIECLSVSGNTATFVYRTAPTAAWYGSRSRQRTTARSATPSAPCSTTRLRCPRARPSRASKETAGSRPDLSPDRSSSTTPSPSPLRRPSASTAGARATASSRTRATASASWRPGGRTHQGGP